MDTFFELYKCKGKFCGLSKNTKNKNIYQIYTVSNIETYFFICTSERKNSYCILCECSQHNGKYSHRQVKKIKRYDSLIFKFYEYIDAFITTRVYLFNFEIFLAFFTHKRDIFMNACRRFVASICTRIETRVFYSKNITTLIFFLVIKQLVHTCAERRFEKFEYTDSLI